MSQSLYQQKNQVTKSMTEQQFEEIVDAILAGKYSWACVLILQTAGYNPLHYIPYRTYNRLIKDNRLKKRDSEQQKTIKPSPKNSVTKHRTSTKISNLSYVESLDESESNSLGGLGCNQSSIWSIFFWNH
ncbi:HetP family heterocyst commitment protein [Crocosphaera chwakensis]|uniref:Heterocyst differentiation protein n=1 Tax=Crocosphaera chwakensis CCY0110 TaxID=391612 RepID=A3IQI5_9CHRO|nr:HetP family heterocyst commitment protein [Crocosphaera chwakensis]EAZ91260.1 heterocyst differentiation protein [Crocosphaera chwakensis CCY0110]